MSATRLWSSAVFSIALGLFASGCSSAPAEDDLAEDDESALAAGDSIAEEYTVSIGTHGIARSKPIASRDSAVTKVKEWRVFRVSNSADRASYVVAVGYDTLGRPWIEAAYAVAARTTTLRRADPKDALEITEAQSHALHADFVALGEALSSPGASTGGIRTQSGPSNDPSTCTFDVVLSGLFALQAALQAGLTISCVVGTVAVSAGTASPLCLIPAAGTAALVATSVVYGREALKSCSAAPAAR